MLGNLLMPAVVVSAAIGLAPSAQADSDQDAKYVQALDILGVPYGSASSAVGAGHATCAGFAKNPAWSQLTNAARKSGYTDSQAGQMVGAAVVGVFCPQYAATMEAQERQAKLT